MSESPFDRVEPYLDLGLPVLIGNEPLIPAGLARGAIGTVSGMSAAFPDVVRAGVDAADDAAAARLSALRTTLEASGQFIAAAKHVLGMRGVPVTTGMRAPLRALDALRRPRRSSAVSPWSWRRHRPDGRRDRAQPVASSAAAWRARSVA